MQQFTPYFKQEPTTTNFMYDVYLIIFLKKGNPEKELKRNNIYICKWLVIHILKMIKLCLQRQSPREENIKITNYSLKKIKFLASVNLYWLVNTLLLFCLFHSFVFPLILETKHECNNKKKSKTWIPQFNCKPYHWLRQNLKQRKLTV